MLSLRRIRPGARAAGGADDAAAVAAIGAQRAAFSTRSRSSARPASDGAAVTVADVVARAKAATDARGARLRHQHARARTSGRGRRRRRRDRGHPPGARRGEAERSGRAVVDAVVELAEGLRASRQLGSRRHGIDPHRHRRAGRLDRAVSAGTKGFDAFMLAGAIILVGASLKILSATFPAAAARFRCARPLAPPSTAAARAALAPPAVRLAGAGRLGRGQHLGNQLTIYSSMPLQGSSAPPPKIVNGEKLALGDGWRIAFQDQLCVDRRREADDRPMGPRLTATNAKRPPRHYRSPISATTIAYAAVSLPLINAPGSSRSAREVRTSGSRRPAGPT